MSKTRKIFYWITTLWLGLGMVSTAAVKLLHYQPKADYTTGLGYPAYFFIILSVWKILGVVTVLIPKIPLLKEWAYAGFFFAMSGAIFSHLATGTVSQIFPSVLLLVLTILSWWLRPADRKIISAN